MKYFKAKILLLILLVHALPGCSTGTTETQLPTTDPDIRGTITRIDRTAESFHIMVEENPLDPDSSPKSRVRVTEKAALLERGGDDLHEIGVDDLKEGYIVSVWFDGPVLQSYPSQSGARVLLLEGRTADSR